MKKASSIDDLFDAQSIGIDVSKAELVTVGIKGDQAYCLRLKNHLEALRKPLQALADSGYQGKLICESTGHYHLPLAVLCASLGLSLVLLNPLQSSKHFRAKVRKVKTDPEDARTLAVMGLTEPNLPRPARINTDNALIRLKMGQLAALEKQIQTQRQSLRQYEETYRELGLPLSPEQQALHEHLEAFRRLRERFAKELEDLLHQSVEDAELRTRLHVIPGFSRMVVGLTCQLDRDVKSERSWVAYTGLDVSIRESGTWTGRGKISKRGNPYLRKRFYQAAWGACLNYPEVRAYYDRLKAAGRKHVEAVCILARKLLRIAYSITVNGSTYDAKIAFQS